MPLNYAEFRKSYGKENFSLTIIYPRTKFGSRSSNHSRDI